MILKLIRWILSQVVLVLDRVTAPEPLIRHPELQTKVDQECAVLSLYQFEGCPFCVKVRRQIRRLGLRIELRDAQRDPVHREALIQGGGELQVPCLRIEEGSSVRWMYESSEINSWLKERFATS
jgi:glutaredoxin